jgi:hypothetical protein
MQFPPLSHDTEPLVGVTHAVQPDPHALTLLATHWLPQKFWPLAHWQDPAAHCLPPVHCRAHAPQLLLSICSLTHAVPHELYPALQRIPQEVPSHVAEPFWGTAQAEQVGPHDVGDELLEQVPLQLCVPAGQLHLPA